VSLQSLQFFAFLLTVVLVNQALVPRPVWRKGFLLAASYYFYALWDWRVLGVLLGITAINFVAGRCIAESEHVRVRRAWLVVASALSLSILALAKYANFFVASGSAFLGALGWHSDPALLNMLLPIGISFFTFQSLSYVFDVYRRQIPACTEVLDFALFVAFFATILAGPITRGKMLLPQLAAMPPTSSSQAESGLVLVARGFIRKLAFADVLAAHLVDPAFADPSRYSSFFLLVALYAYSFQIYMDVAGYTDIARGMARLVGFELPSNFDRPYLARSVSNFWQRWHMSVSSFFRDYLFFGLGGSRRGNVYLNLMLTFLAIGLWHGAGWNFVAYGAAHGSVVCLERWWRQRERPILGLPPAWSYALGVAATFHFIVLSRILFRAGDIDSARAYADALLHSDATLTRFDVISVTVLALAALAHVLPARWSELTLGRFARLPTVAQAAAFTMAILVLAAVSTSQPGFVYFRF
jgi:D-alanyl-lipoteichoic acid acyltransferase DltB (MBOAT superfamily)